MSVRAIELANRLKEVLTEGKWVTGTNYVNEISDISFEKATKSVQGLNTIADLTFHILYYIKGVNEVFNGKPLTIKDKYSFDGPEINNEESWNHLRSEFLTHSNILIEHVEKLNDKKLSADFANEDYGSYERNINAMIEHCYYHFGQIKLIKKMIEKN